MDIYSESSKPTKRDQNSHVKYLCDKIYGESGKAPYKAREASPTKKVRATAVLNSKKMKDALTIKDEVFMKGLLLK